MRDTGKDTRERGDHGTARMLAGLVDLRAALAAADLPLDAEGVAQRRAERDATVGQLEDYVIPRLSALDAPLLAVVGGSTGAGKSTLVNALAGRVVSPAGVLRPTTRSPVLVHHPDDGRWFGPDRLLPDLTRVTGEGGDPDAVRLVAADAVPRGLALLDAPDIDSVEERNRALATQLLAAADLWLFVTSAARYADQVPWDFLRRAAERSTAVAVVLDRTSPEASDTVAGDLARMLASRGLRESPLFVVEEGPVGDDGLLPVGHVTEVREWLQELAADAWARSAVVTRTVEGAIREATRSAHGLADACGGQREAADRLRADLVAAYDAARADVERASADGTLLRGEVLARWQELIGGGELLRALETRVGLVRDRLLRRVRGRPPQADRVTVAVESGLETLVVEQAEVAAERAAAAWRAHPDGAGLLARAPVDLSRASRDLRGRAQEELRAWQEALLSMVREEGAGRRNTARFLALGVNGLGVSLMVVVLAHTGGALVGAETAVAGGTAVIGQKLLEAVFGDQAVRRLAERARQDLSWRVEGLLDAEQERFVRLLPDVDAVVAASHGLREAARRVDDLRFERARRPPAEGATGGMGP